MCARLEQKRRLKCATIFFDDWVIKTNPAIIPVSLNTANLHVCLCELLCELLCEYKFNVEYF